MPIIFHVVSGTLPILIHTVWVEFFAGQEDIWGLLETRAMMRWKALLHCDRVVPEDKAAAEAC